MPKARFLPIQLMLVFVSVNLFAQEGGVLREVNGVSLSYSMRMQGTCKEGSYEYKIYKYTVTLANRSGKAIKMDRSWVQSQEASCLHCISDCRSFCKTDFYPSGELNASPEWDTRGVPWPNNSVITQEFCIGIPKEQDKPRGIDFFMGAFVFMEKKVVQEPKWSEWKTGGCYPGLSYQYKVTEFYNLTKQVHYEFRVKSSYSEKVDFVMSLRDEYGKERFGSRYSIAPGGEISFVHKMEDNYIRSTGIERAWFPADVNNREPSLCDGKREANEDLKKQNAELAQRLQQIISTTPFREEQRREFQATLNNIVQNEKDERQKNGRLKALESNLEYSGNAARQIQEEKEKQQQLKAGNNEIAGRIRNRLNKMEQNATTSGYRNEVDNIMNSRSPDDIINKQLLALEEKINTEETARQQKEEKARQENGEMVNRIQAAINNFPAEGRKAELQSRLDVIVNAKTDETSRNQWLSDLENYINSETEKVKANIEQFNQDKEKRTEQINNIRQTNQEIRRNQAELAAGYGSFLAAIFSMRGRTGPNASYRGASTLFAIQTGLHLNIQPVGYKDVQSGSKLSKSTGALSSYYGEVYDETLFYAPGLYLNMAFHPVFSNAFSIGLKGGGLFGFWPEANDGTTTSTFSTASNSMNTVLEWNYGAEITAGFKPVKLLTRLQMRNTHILKSGQSSSTREDAFYSYEYGSYYDADQKWKTTWASAGLRFGNYDKSKLFVDIAYSRFLPTQVNTLKTGKQTGDLLKKYGSDQPVGGYLQVSKMNGFCVRLEYMKNYMNYDEVANRTVASKKSYFNLTVGRNFEWFGKPFKKAKAGR